MLIDNQFMIIWQKLMLFYNKGLLMIAKERPEDPIKNLGLFLINYKK
jgi:hypothetical protein